MSAAKVLGVAVVWSASLVGVGLWAQGSRWTCRSETRPCSGVCNYHRREHWLSAHPRCS